MDALIGAVDLKDVVRCFSEAKLIDDPGRVVVSSDPVLSGAVSYYKSPQLNMASPIYVVYSDPKYDR